MVKREGIHSMTETEETKVTVLRETDKAYLFINGVLDQSWFPKSEVSFKSRNIKTGEAVAEIPTWLLEQKDWPV